MELSSSDGVPTILIPMFTTITNYSTHWPTHPTHNFDATHTYTSLANLKLNYCILSGSQLSILSLFYGGLIKVEKMNYWLSIFLAAFTMARHATTATLVFTRVFLWPFTGRRTRQGLWQDHWDEWSPRIRVRIVAITEGQAFGSRVRDRETKRDTRQGAVIDNQ